jgi:hypothetical protein
MLSLDRKAVEPRSKLLRPASGDQSPDTPSAKPRKTSRSEQAGTFRSPAGGHDLVRLHSIEPLAMPERFREPCNEIAVWFVHGQEIASRAIDVIELISEILHRISPIDWWSKKHKERQTRRPTFDQSCDGEWIPSDYFHFSNTDCDRR